MSIRADRPTDNRQPSDQLSEDAIRDDMRYLQLLAQTYPTVADASTEIINLEAILNLPKPTEHFISDPHGESEAFNHVLRNASGYVKRKVEEIFGIIRDLHQAGSTILLVEQNAQAALSIADRGYVLETGQIGVSGAGAELLQSPEIKKAYLGG